MPMFLVRSLGCVGTLLLLVSGCGETPPLEPSCATVSCGAGQCVLEGDGPVCQCDDGYRAEGLRCVELPVPPDDHADTTAGATPLTPPSTGSGRIERLKDRDVFSFLATPGHIYRFGCAPKPTCYISLLAPWGQVASGRESSDHQEAQYEAEFSGTHFVVVFTADTLDTLDYQYWFEDLGPDDHGDRLATATRMSVGTAMAGEHGAPGDVDAFAWPSERRRMYRVTVTDSQASMRVRVFDAARQFLATSSIFSAPSTGTLVTEVWNYQGFSRRTPYTVRVEALGFDDHGSFVEAATELPVPTLPAEARADYPGDVDIFRFFGEWGHTYRIRCVTGTPEGCEVVLRDGVHNWVTRGMNELRYTVTRAGSYSFSLAPAGVATGGTYTYALEVVGMPE